MDDADDVLSRRRDGLKWDRIVRPHHLDDVYQSMSRTREDDNRIPYPAPCELGTKALLAFRGNGIECRIEQLKFRPHIGIACDVTLETPEEVDKYRYEEDETTALEVDFEYLQISGRGPNDMETFRADHAIGEHVDLDIRSNAPAEGRIYGTTFGADSVWYDALLTGQWIEGFQYVIHGIHSDLIIPAPSRHKT